MLGDVEGHAPGEAVHRALELGVGERLHLAAGVADHVVVMVLAAARGLVAGAVLTDLDAAEHADAGELVEHAVDRRAGHRAAAGAQLVLDLVGAQRALLTVEQLDDRRAGAAPAEARLGEPALRVLTPVVHRCRW